MFFSDNGPTPKIEKAYLDGQDREVIVSTELSRVLSLSVDVENNILYWVDNRRHTIEASNYDGSKRRVIKRINGIQFTGLFYYQVLMSISHLKILIATYILGIYRGKIIFTI